MESRWNPTIEESGKRKAGFNKVFRYMILDKTVHFNNKSKTMNTPAT